MLSREIKMELRSLLASASRATKIRMAVSECYNAGCDYDDLAPARVTAYALEKKVMESPIYLAAVNVVKEKAQKEA